MKKTLLLLSAIILFFAGCNKDPEVTPMKVTSEVTHLGGGTVMRTGSYEYMMNIEGGEFEIRYSLNEDMSSAQSEKVVPVGNDFSVTLTGLDIDKQYYYRFYFSGKYNSFETEVQRFNLGDGDDADYVMHKNVLLENYQGVRCVNCPSANELAIDLQDKYAGRLIVLGVHAGDLCSPIGGFHDFRTEEGTTWYNFFGFEFNPIGTVNRKTNDGEYYGFNTTQWSEAVIEALQEPAFVGMMTQVEYDNDNRNLDVIVKSKFMTELSGRYSLTVCIMEDSIVGAQVTPSNGTDANYVHRYVFRQTINGAWGEGLCWGNINVGDEFVKSYTITFDKYNVDRCYILAYVSNTETKEIMQVVQTKITDDYSQQETTGTINGHDWVDLGLPSGLKWATCNVGADAPEDHGNYYAWGETTTKSEYTIDNSLTYELTYSDLQSQGYIDGEGNLTSSHDAASANWGGTWRLPTKAEFEELIDNCTWWKIIQNGEYVYKVTGPNGNQILLPSAGYRRESYLYNEGDCGQYWSSSSYESGNYFAYRLYFDSGSLNVNWDYRLFGQSVRPVSE